MFRRWVAGCLLVGLFAFALRSNASADEPQAWAAAHLKELLTLYKHFHHHPELSLE